MSRTGIIRGDIRPTGECDYTYDCFYRRPADFLRSPTDYQDDPREHYDGKPFTKDWWRHKFFIWDRAIVHFLYRRERMMYWIFITLVLILISFITLHQSIYSHMAFAYFTLGLMFYFMVTKNEVIVVDMYVKISALYMVYRYLYWRVTESITYTGFFDFLGTIMIFYAETYSTLLFSLGLFTSIMILNRRVINLEGVPKEELPTVDVFIPSYNEPYQMVADTVIAAKMFDYPPDSLAVHVLDDGGTDQKCNDPNPQKAKEAKERRQMFLELAEKTGTDYLTRAKNLHAKAGNMNSALKVTNGDLVLILDCDHIPTRDFLQNTVGWFMKVPQIFLVQTPHAFYNPDPIEKNLNIFGLAPAENDMFYKYIQRGHDFWDSSFFCGSAAIIRRKYLTIIGGIAGDTITEDAETALTLHAAGLKSAYIAIPMVRGLQAESFDGLVLQRIRWDQGMIQIFILKNAWKYGGLSWYQKMSYTSASFFWFFPFARVIFLTAPLFYIFFGLEVYKATDMELVAYTAPHLFVAIFISQFIYGHVRWGYFSDVYESSLAIFTLPAAIEVMMNPTDPEFEVTPKGEDSSKDRVSNLAIQFVWFSMLFILGFIVGIYKWFAHPELHAALAMTMAWLVFNSIFIVTSLAIASEKKQLRQYVRIPSNERIIVKIDTDTYIGKIIDMSLSGMAIKFPDKIIEEMKPKLTPGKEIKILVYDNDGRLFAIYGNFLRFFFGNRFTMRFKNAETDLELRKKLVALIFGEKSRWHEMDYQEDPKGPFASLWMLFSSAAKSASIKVAYKMTWLDFKRELKEWFRIGK
ncbi:MAG TPA: UDP-forming cellulose synthase catalytic subunit [Campylobacterales bacterium]|nr:UDP-forming cellulose synthase catalytic subunit [Campylobacterales bacterium]